MTDSFHSQAISVQTGMRGLSMSSEGSSFIKYGDTTLNPIEQTIDFFQLVLECMEQDKTCKENTISHILGQQDFDEQQSSLINMFETLICFVKILNSYKQIHIDEKTDTFSQLEQLGLYENIIKSQVYQNNTFLYYLNFFNDSEIYMKLPTLFKSLVDKLEKSKIYNPDEEDLAELDGDILY